MKKLYALAAIALLFDATATALAEGDATAGQEKAAACAACHGPDGNSVNGEWPKLAGQNAIYLEKQLANFKAGERVNAIMNGMAAPLDEVAMKDIAAYYAAQVVTPGKADPALVEQGQSIYRGGNLTSGVSACIGCHGPTGKGNPAAGFPSLDGQHAQYVETQLKAFRAMQRANDPGQMMRNIAAKMSDQEIQAVASYIQGLQ
jgi:cytochrome c553